MIAKASACCVLVFLFLVAVVAVGAADPVPQPPEAGLVAESFGPGDCAGSGEEPAAISSLVASPLDGAVPAATIPECALGGRELIGCCTGFTKSKWRCAEFCCKNGSCGLLCTRVWCEFAC